MIAAIDVHYRETFAKAVGVLFNWEDEQPQQTLTVMCNDIDEYVPGEFYKRELPCILRILEQIDISSLEALLVDGHVYTDNNKKMGLGGHLYNELKGVIPVIGVAKTSFYTNAATVVPVYRGESKKPLFVSAIGMDVVTAADKVKEMKGSYRMPFILKELDSITKND